MTPYPPVFARGADGVYIVGDWPDEVLFSLTLLQESDTDVMRVTDGQVKVTVINGDALYRLEPDVSDPLELQVVRGRLVESTRRE